MDTRAKIIDSTEAARLAAGGATVVSGYFDPLLAWHAQRLQHMKSDQPVIVVIANPTHAILPARARAELVASLGSVDYVVESRAIPMDALRVDHHLETEDGRRFEQLVAHVHARQQGAS